MSSNTTSNDTNSLDGYSKIALIIGIIGIGIALAGFFMGVSQNDPRPLLGYLLGFSFWLSMGIGMLFLIILFYLFDAGWAIIIRRQLEHAVGGFKVLALIFIPFLLVAWGVIGSDTGLLWHWASHDSILPGGETVGNDVLYHKKHGFLNLSFFTVRVFLFFGIWIVLAESFRKFSYTLDKDGNASWVTKARKLAAVGIFLCALSATFAAIDWFKTLEFHWFSTMYGVWFFAGSMRAALAGTVIICILLASKGYLKGIFKPSHSYLLGCLMLAFTVFWAYISFCQYFLIYNANIPEETFWYNIRELTHLGENSSWWYISLGLIFFHFFFPFIYLLWYKNKFGVRIIFISVWILFFHIIDLYFNILPGRITDPSADNPLGYTVREFHIPITGFIWDISMIIGVGGICAYVFMKNMSRNKPIPIKDPRILESINYNI